MSVYSLDNEDSQSVADIFKNLPKLEVFAEYKKTLENVTDKACDELLSYMEDEYILRFEEVIMHKARKLIQELLKGENLDEFALKAKKHWNSDELFTYDSDKIRKAIVRDFANEIQNAELLELQKDNKRLEESLKWARERNY
jgi:hypothetical protein